MNQKGLAPIIVVIVITIAALVFLYNSKSSVKENIQQVQVASSSAQPKILATIAPLPTPSSNPSPNLATAKPQPTPAKTEPTLAPTTPNPVPPVVTNNTPPGAGYSRQTVSVDGQNFPVSIVAADLNSTKVIVDTASEDDCKDNCPAMPLADYVSRSGAYAGINGSFFCPPEYDNCKDKKNSFDTLVMNKNKRYFNSDNNVYSTIPAAIFTAGSARFVSRSLEWGRDTGVDAVIANYPLLIAGSNINYTENPSEPKFGQKGTRCFIAAKGNIVYIGVISNATMGDSAKVLKALSMDEALNLDEGGSTALWYEGYKFGPGRNVPNAVLFVRR